MCFEYPPPPLSEATAASLLPMRSTARTEGWLRGSSRRLALASWTICAKVLSPSETSSSFEIRIEWLRRVYGTVSLEE